MEFQPGDDAVHPTYGVGHIVRCEVRQLGESTLQPYYVLSIGSTTVWVPRQADGSTTLRAVTVKQELEQYRLILKGRPLSLERDHLKRQAAIHERLKPGSFQSLCEVVRDLTALGWQRPINERDAGVLQRIGNNLRREWAIAAGLSLPDAIQEVNALLRAGRSAYKV